MMTNKFINKCTFNFFFFFFVIFQRGGIGKFSFQFFHLLIRDCSKPKVTKIEIHIWLRPIIPNKKQEMHNGDWNHVAQKN